MADSKPTQNIDPLGSVKELLLDTALYQPIPFQKTDDSQLFDLKHFAGTIDFYCCECEKNSTHQGSNAPFSYRGTSHNTFDGLINHCKPRNLVVPILLVKNQYYNVTTFCTRNKDHISLFIFKVTSSQIEKIGQYPSLSSLSKPNLEKYRKVLAQEEYKEFNRAIGLTTYGVGIGAFVYLRRIFENLIAKAHQHACKEPAWDEEKFKRSRMSEKIQLLENNLPEFLVTNSTVYGILSKGLHELTEAECLKYFPILKAGIELMLDEVEEERIKLEKTKQISKDIEAITKDLKN